VNGLISRTGGFRTREEVADRVHMSPRTLRRRLASYGVNFADLLDEERRKEAQLLLPSSDRKRRYDLLLWRKPDGETVDICFDVTTVFEDTIREIEREEEHGYPHSPAR
jgi:AraC-like DNA-binding protein